MLCVFTLSFTIQAAMQNEPVDPGVREERPVQELQFQD